MIGIVVRPVEAPMLEGLFQPMHLLIIFFIALLVFGPKKLPELGKGLGEGIRALKEGMKDGIKDNSQTQASTDPSKKTETKS
jgi:sec-independent protein translocase protein TatA